MKHVDIAEQSFAKFGKFVYDNKWKLAAVSFFINCAFGLGILSLVLNNDIEILFRNKNSETRQLEEKLLKFYPDQSGDNFIYHSSVKYPQFVEIIVSGKNKENLLHPILINETENVIDFISSLTITSDYLGVVAYKDLCAKNSEECVISGLEIIKELRHCKEMDLCYLDVSRLKYLYPKETMSSILEHIGSYNKSNDMITSARYIKLRFYLQQNSNRVLQDSKAWKRVFIRHMSGFKSECLDILYAHSTSLMEELGEDTYSDIQYFSLSFTIFLLYMGFYISGGDCVSKKVNIGRMGTIVVPLSVLGAWGLVCGTGFQFTNTVGVMPYFALYYEINNVIITLNNVTQHLDRPNARDRISMSVRKSGVPITVTTITYVATFVVGISSGYMAVEIFSVFTGTSNLRTVCHLLEVATILFIYANHMVFFTACLSIHEQRIDGNRHFCVCQPVQPKNESSNRSCCFRCCCTGEKPTSAQDTYSTLEKLSRKLFSYFVLREYIKHILLFTFAVFTCVSVWKMLHIKVDFFTPNMVTYASYYRKFSRVNNLFFTSNFYVSFVMPGNIHFEDTKSVHDIFSFESNILSNKYIDSTSLISWIDEYAKALNDSMHSNATANLSLTSFLVSNSKYKHDVTFDTEGLITYSRFYAKTHNIHTLADVNLVKQSLIKDYYISYGTVVLQDDVQISKKTAKPSGASLTIYAPMFMYTDEYFSPLVETIIQLCVLVVTNIFLTTLVCPHLCCFIISFSCFASTVITIFACMSFFQVKITPFSMIITVLGTCYIVDVNTHILNAFYNTIGISRLARAHEVLSTTSVTLFNTTVASFIGMLVLFVGKSYVFLTVMKIFMITIAVCCIQAVFILPITLSLFGPKDENLPKSADQSLKVKTIAIARYFANPEQNNCKGASTNLPSNLNCIDLKQQTLESGAFENKAFEENDIAAPNSVKL